MQSNNSPNQIPEPAMNFDATLMNLLTEVIAPAQYDEMDEFLRDVARDQLNSADGTGLLQVQTGQVASMGQSGYLTSPTQNNSRSSQRSRS